MPAAPSASSFTPRLSASSTSCIVDVLDTFDLRDRTNLWALLGAKVPASPPDTFVLPLSALTVLLQLRAPLLLPAPPLQEAQTGELGEHDQGPTGELEEATAKFGKGEGA